MIAGIKRLVNIYILLFIYYYGRAQLTKWPGHGHSARCRGVVYRVCVCVCVCVDLLVAIHTDVQL